MNRMSKLGLAIAAAVLTVPLSVAAQLQTNGIEPRHEYAVKIVCGRITSSNGPLSIGVYATAVNLHNPGATQQFRRKVAVALPGVPGKYTKFNYMALKSDEAVEFDCNQIFRQLKENQHPPVPFVKGFLIVQSQRELDVVAVYTAAPTNTGQVATIHTERVPPRKM